MPLSEKEKLEIVSGFGADCAFFIKNKPVLATGTGNIFEEVQVSLKGKYLVLVWPDLFISTKEAYARIKPRNAGYDLKKIIENNPANWKGILHNDFEDAVFPLYPVLPQIKDQLYNAGAFYASMSGSGSAMYGLFDGKPTHQISFPPNYLLWEGVISC